MAPPGFYEQQHNQPNSQYKKESSKIYEGDQRTFSKHKIIKKKKIRIQETLKLALSADSSTNTKKSLSTPPPKKKK